MKFNLERPIRFNRDSEHKSLYSWSLHEMSPAGEKLDRDLIPWSWTLRFAATGLRLHRDYRLERSRRVDGTVGSEQHTSVALGASLRLDSEYSSESRWSGTKLTMLGTEREVTEISLRVEPLASEAEVERCKLWGCPSYTTEIDFRDHTFPDMLQLQLSVTPSRFRELSELTTCPHPISLSVLISRVAGFYSDWSPAIGTDKVKILTNEEDHVVADAPSGDGTLSRLGDVGEFTLSLIQHAAVHTPDVTVESDEDASDFDAPSAADVVTTAEVEALQKVLRELAVTRRTVASIRTPMWIVVVLLGLLLLLR